MTLIEQIQQFKVFECNTFVVFNGQLFKIEELPGYKCRWCDEIYFTQDWNKVKGSWERVGYNVARIKKNELEYSSLNLFAELEQFNSKVHIALIPDFEKLQLLLEVRRIKDEIWQLQYKNNT